MHEKVYDCLIVGAGVSGYGAALYCARFRMDTIVLSKDFGGVINWANHVGNYPGIPDITGLDLADRIKNHALSYGAVLKLEEVENLDKLDGNFKITTTKGVYLSKSLIVATGSEKRRLGIPGEKELEGNGVHSCAICDGFLYKGKKVGVVGGSDSAAKEALVLAEYAEKVYILYRKERIRAEPIIYEKILRADNIEIINNTNVVEVKGNKKLETVVLDKPYEGMNELLLDGLFIEVGHTPLSQLVRTVGVELNEKGEIITDKMSRTNIDGIFAAGDVTDTEFKQAITGVSQGVTAAYMAFKYNKSRPS